ncbi:MAG: hypothetical protein LBB88_02760 [Planctomycetaceae bacterium]|jgi:chromosome segregation and condensation protein ScpB|nr:hypothetical protein [Planctomycetaceae bacterium]
MSERTKEIRRRRKRRANYAALKSKLAKVGGKFDTQTKQKYAEKLRKLSPGADIVIKTLGLE